MPNLDLPLQPSIVPPSPKASVEATKQGAPLYKNHAI